MAVIIKPYDKKIRRSFKPIGSSMTQQNFKAECDINKILLKYKKTGLVNHLNAHGGRYEDLSEPVDYQTALNVVIAAQNAFSSLPSDIRKKFGNDPGEFLEFVNDPENAQEMYDMGLSNSAPEPVPAVPVPDPVPAEPEA